MILTPGLRRRIIRWAAAAALPLTVSCLDIAADIEIRPSGAVITAMEYTLPKEIAHFGRGFGADEPWPLPLTEKEFRRVVLRRGGVTLKRWRVKNQKNQGDTVRVMLHADNFESMAGFFGWNAELLPDKNGGELKFTFPPLENTGDLPPEQREYLESLFGGSRFELRIKTPRKPKAVQGGSGDGRGAVFSLNLSELLSAESPLLWSVRW